VNPIRPEWRTSTVLELCLSMRESRDYSALPILADALQDADCNDEELLSRLRRGPTGSADDCRLVALVFSDEAREAVRRIEEIAADLGPPTWYGDGDEDRTGDPLTVDLLLETARECNREKYSWDAYIHMGVNEAYKGGFPEKEFWECYRVLTGEAVRDSEASFFSCSC
jgi:hypothetical protein